MGINVLEEHLRSRSVSRVRTNSTKSRSHKGTEQKGVLKRSRPLFERCMVILISAGTPD